MQLCWGYPIYSVKAQCFVHFTVPNQKCFMISLVQFSSVNITWAIHVFPKPFYQLRLSQIFLFPRVQNMQNIFLEPKSNKKELIIGMRSVTFVHCPNVWCAYILMAESFACDSSSVILAVFFLIGLCVKKISVIINNYLLRIRNEFRIFCLFFTENFFHVWFALFW